jgi:serine/threonine protein kinase, bacterial
VASALDYAHKQGLLHRDVKPANIMLTQRGDDEEQRILLADLGIARNVDDISGLTATNMTVGTVAYSAPEQLIGEEIDGRADQYALAATAYNLLTGSHLFPHSNPAVVISRHLNSPPPALADVHPDLAALHPVLQAALAKDPAARFARCSDFARSLAEQCSSVASVGAVPTAPAPQHRPAAAVKQPAPAEPPTVARTRPAWLIFAAMAVLIAATAAVLTWHPWQRTDRSGTPNPTLSAPPPANPTTAPSALPSRASSSPTSATTTSVAVAALPAYPPTNSGCQGTVTAHHDIDHKTLGAVRIFLMLNTTPGTDSEGCIAAVTAAGAVLPAIPLDARETFGFANPATDSTGNTFITYNPGRYDGVLVLIPNAGGFEDIGWDNTGGSTQHYYGRHAYYYAQLVGPGPDGRYTIRQSGNDCTPSCAGGTTTTKDLHWSGSDYVS